jgi:hypothetical protein
MSVSKISPSTSSFMRDVNQSLTRKRRREIIRKGLRQELGRKPTEAEVLKMEELTKR